MIKNRQLASAAYGTHIHPLVASVMATSGPVVEFGMGDYSTPILHEICKAQGRPLLSLESHPDWWQNFLDLEEGAHNIIHVKDWDDPGFMYIPGNGLKIGVIFIDHAPAERRIVDIEKYKDLCEIMVVHDSEKRKYYGYNEAFNMFKYQYEYERYSKKTMVLSNTVDVAELFNA